MRTVIFLFITLFIISESKLCAQKHYYKAQAHCHTTNSDGALAPVDVMYQYGIKGYRILFITDHGYMTDGEALSNPLMLCINSEEVTFHNHVNAFNIRHTIDDANLTIQPALDSIHAQGAMAMVNHPIPRYPSDWSLSCLDFQYLNYIDFMEIHNGGTELYAPDDHTLWDCVLSGGKKIYGLATDDSHDLNLFDLGWIMIKLNPENITKQAVIDAMKNGDFYASSGIEITNYELVDNQTINVSCSNCTKIRFIGPNHQTLQETTGTYASYTRNGELYVRAELEDDGLIVAKKMAWAQPEFFDKPASVNENKGYKTADIYPNPVQNSAMVSYYSPEGLQAMVIITNLQGQEMMKIDKLCSFKGNNAYVLDVSSLCDGIYIFTIKTGDKLTNAKLVVKR